MKRNDDFETRREHLKDLSDAELETRFWSLIEELIDPLLKLGYENTTPAIERSVLLRMGFSSLEAKALVEGCTEHNLLEHGAGKHVNAQLSFARSNGIDIHFGNPEEEVPGKSIILPAHPSMIKARPADMTHLRTSLIHNAIKMTGKQPTDEDIDFLAAETKTNREFVKEHLA